jgi:hypothetical protein
MTPVDPSQGLAAALQAQLARARQRAPAPRGASSAAATGSRRTGAVSRALAQRIAALAPEDPERPRKAVRIYLEAELAREFGASVLNDPEFPALLDAVQARLQEDAQTAAAVAALGRLLLAGKAHPP